jgi:MFS family permease
MNQKNLAAVSAIGGSAIEYYNYMLFTFLVGIWGAEILPPGGDILKNGFQMIFLAALTRPIAAILIGKIGDRIGRRQALFFCTCVMSLSCLIMSYLPRYSTHLFSSFVPFIIIICRILQTASAAGKLNGSAIFLLENHPGYAGLMSGIIWFFTILGMCSAAFAESICVKIPGSWRIAMRIGAFATFIGLINVLFLEESKEFKSSTNKEAADKPSLWGKLSVLFMGASIGGMFYYLSNYIPIHIQRIVGSNVGQERLILLISYAVASLIGGILSDPATHRRAIRLKIGSSYLLLILILFLMRPVWTQLLLIQQGINLVIVLSTLLINNRRYHKIIRYFTLFRSICLVCTSDQLVGLTSVIPLISLIPRFTTTYAIIAATVLALPTMHSLNTTKLLFSNFILTLCVGIFVGPSHKIMKDMFPPRKRYTSISLFYGIGTAVMGGGATSICLELVKLNPDYPAFFMLISAVLGMLSLITYRIHTNTSSDSDV